MQGHGFIEGVRQCALANAQRIAFQNSNGESLTYGELQQRSDALACWLVESGNLPDGMPVVLYGHKSPYMLVCMLACAKAGHAYAPIDIVYPA
ncbi:MAG: AMP-binding protein, partial [Coriobacteriales bacterium]|nr:AMP-binding protein [Coriobacteriales bacterium]